MLLLIQISYFRNIIETKRDRKQKDETNSNPYSFAGITIITGYLLQYSTAYRKITIEYDIG
jgi:hypothetical protein